MFVVHKESLEQPPMEFEMHKSRLPTMNQEPAIKHWNSWTLSQIKCLISQSIKCSK